MSSSLASIQVVRHSTHVIYEILKGVIGGQHTSSPVLAAFVRHVDGMDKSGSKEVLKELFLDHTKEVLVVYSGFDFDGGGNGQVYIAFPSPLMTYIACTMADAWNEPE